MSNMFDENANLFRSLGFDGRVPLVKSRYNSSLNDRGKISRLRLLNVSSASKTKGDAFHKKVMDEIGGSESRGMTSFFIQAVSYVDNEKHQIMQTFGDDTAVFFFGRAPRMITISGVLIDDVHNNWFYKFLTIYDRYLRGTRLARNFRLINLELPNATMTGVILGMQYDQSSENDTVVRFSFSMLVKNYEPVSATPFVSQETAHNLTQQFAEKVKAGAPRPTTKASEVNSPEAARKWQVENRKSTPVSQYQKLRDMGLTGLLPPGVDKTMSTVDSLMSLGKSGKVQSSVPGASGGLVNVKNGSILDKAVALQQLGLTNFLPEGVNGVIDTARFFSGLSGKTKASAEGAKKLDTLSQIEAFSAQSENALAEISNWFGQDSQEVSVANATLGTVSNIVGKVLKAVDAVRSPVTKLAGDYTSIAESVKNMKGSVTNLPQTMLEKVMTGLQNEDGAGISMSRLGSLIGGAATDSVKEIVGDTGARTTEMLRNVGVAASTTGATVQKVFAI